MWSTSRRPGCAQINVHLLDGCPGIVIPVPIPNTHSASNAQIGMVRGRNAGVPVAAWSSWTLQQMLCHQQQSQPWQSMTGHGAPLPSSYSPSRHYNEICSWVLGMVDRDALDPKIRAAGTGAFEHLLGTGVAWIIDGALGAAKGLTVGGAKDGKVYGAFDSDRAGIVALRF